MKLTPTASQTVGPFFSIGLEHLYKNCASEAASSANAITIQGTVFDADRNPIPDAVLEFWHSNNFARIATTETGSFSLVTRKPIPLELPDGTTQSPHLSVLVFMRGLLKPAFTRVYFSNDPTLANDPALKLVPPSRIATLLAHPQGAPGLYSWNIAMQGQDETVFLRYVPTFLPT